MNDRQVRAGVCLFCSGQISMSRVRVCHMEAACDRAELLAGVSALKGEKEQKRMQTLTGRRRIKNKESCVKCEKQQIVYFRLWE